MLRVLGVPQAPGPGRSTRRRKPAGFLPRRRLRGGRLRRGRRRGCRLVTAALVATGCLAAVSGCAEQPAALPPLHPAFSVTAEELDEVLEALGPDHAERVIARPEVFLDRILRVLAEPPELTVLVDKEHALEPDYVPPDLVALEGYPITVNRPGHKLSRRIMPDLLAMIEAARADGLELMVSSAYRSYDYQAGVYRRHVDQLGAEEADRVSARPGHSQHQLGTTIDFGSISDGYGETANGRWMAANAWRFGFSLSYLGGQQHATGYDYEPWHFRYVGRIGTGLEREFFGGLQQPLLEFLTEWAWWFELRRVDSEAAEQPG